jgi:hypothetical protein
VVDFGADAPTAACEVVRITELIIVGDCEFITAGPLVVTSQPGVAEFPVCIVAVIVVDPDVTAVSA